MICFTERYFTVGDYDYIIVSQNAPFPGARTACIETYYGQPVAFLSQRQYDSFLIAASL